MSNMAANAVYRGAKDFNRKLLEIACSNLDSKQCRLQSSLLLQPNALNRKKDKAEGFELLTNVITSGNSRGDDHPRDSFRPTTEQLSLAVTLTVHPKFTTRAESLEVLLAADEALRFLKGTLETIGPINGGFAQAFVCRSSPSRADGKKRQSRSNSSESEEQSKKLTSVFAHKHSLFLNVSDIWQIVGWAFNCSVVWPNRWARWKLFLDFFLDLLERDFTERLRLDDIDESHDYLGHCMILRFLHSAEGRTGRRRFMKAVMANGTTNSVKEFREIFKNETRERRIQTKEQKDEQKMAKRVKLSTEKDLWAEYEMDDEEDSVADSPQSSTSLDSLPEECDPDAQRLRARFFELVS
jgi:hypothetical protein